MDKRSKATSPAGEMDVEVIFCASRSIVDSSRLRLPHGTSVDDAVRAAGTLQRHPEIGALGWRIGIWGRTVTAAQLLRDGDRIEIYRPLLVEPKEARRLRQRNQSAKGVLQGNRRNAEGTLKGR